MSPGFPQTLAGLQPGVAPHVGAAVRAGDVEQGDTLELWPISQLEWLSITLNIRTRLEGRQKQPLFYIMNYNDNNRNK